MVLALSARISHHARADEPTPPLPSAADAIEAFNSLDAWIRAWNVPSEPRKIDPPGVTAACITLRLGGKVLGRGTAVSDDGAAIWSAARDAFVQATQSLPVEPDALRERRIEEMVPRITIDAQFAGQFTPMLVESEAAIALQLKPGVEGIAVRLADRTDAVFPAVMLAAGTTPSEGVRIAISRLGLPARPLGELMRATGLVVYRFPVRHLVQPREQAAPEFLYRGGRIIATNEVTGSRLREAASLIAAHIISHAWPGQEPFGMLGDYKTVNDRYDPHIAPPLEQAGCALALAFYARTPGIPAREAIRSRRFAAEVLSALTVVAQEETDPLSDPLACAMWLAAEDALRSTDAARLLPDEFRTKALGVVRATLSADHVWTAAAPPQGRSLIAWSLALAATRDDSLREAASAAVRSVFRETDPARLVSELPWLGWAELALLRPDEEVPALLALVQLRDTAYTFQLTEKSIGSDSPDFLGGIVFTRTRTPLPTWNALRPLTFFATMLGDPRLTPDGEVIAELARMKPSLRYLLQLMIDDPLTHMMRDRDRSRGGVRTALWDQTASLEPAAMALLCLSETLHAMEARGGKK